MAAKKKAAAKVAEPAKPTAAAKAKDAEEKSPVYRVDLGESLPPQPPHGPKDMK